jgi:anti-sigma factor RsiW
MWFRHPKTILVPYVRGELAPDRFATVDSHVRRCSECRKASEALADVLSDLAQSFPAAPEVDWDRYRAQLRSKLRKRISRPERAWYGQPRLLGAAAVCAGAAALVIVLSVRGRFSPSEPAQNLAPWQEAAIGSQLDLIENFPVVERLDLLENLGVIQDLDELSSEPGGEHGA